MILLKILGSISRRDTAFSKNKLPLVAISFHLQIEWCIEILFYFAENFFPENGDVTV